MKIGIVGAGLMGRLLAFVLSHKDAGAHAVTLFEEDSISDDMQNASAAAYTAAGMCSPISESDVIDNTMLQQGMYALSRWPHIISELKTDVGYRNTGSVILAHNSEAQDLAFFQKKISSDTHTQAKIKTLDSAAITALEPELSRFHTGLFINEEAWVNPVLLLNALLKTARSQGCELVDNCRPDSINPYKIRCGETRYDLDWVIDCRGLGAKSSWENLRGVRGEVVWLHAPEVNLKHLVRLIHPRYRVYIVPRDNHHYLIGASEIESDSRDPITVRSIMELLSAAYSVHSGFAEASIIETRVNCRPALIDNHPKILSQPGLIRVNGLFRHGFMLAPTLTDNIATHIQNPDSNIEQKYPHTFAEVPHANTV